MERPPLSQSSWSSLILLGLGRGSVRTCRAPPPLLALRSVVLEPDHGRNTASHVAPLVATLPWPLSMKQTCPALFTALARLGLGRGSVRTRRAPPPLLALRSVVLEPDRGRNIAPHVAAGTPPAPPTCVRLTTRVVKRTLLPTYMNLLSQRRAPPPALECPGGCSATAQVVQSSRFGSQACGCRARASVRAGALASRASSPPFVSLVPSHTRPCTWRGGKRVECLANLESASQNAPIFNI